jgi:prepilin-type N-terminal cleavage/methylation domain-containing protein
MKKGFTLIELLLVIGILAILAAAVVLTLNPAQLLAQARDSQRISDLNSVKSAVSLYLATATSTSISSTKTSTNSTTCWFGATCNTACTAVTTSTAVNGNGWVPIDLTQTSGGSPLSALPLDPTNDANYHYAYAGNNSEKTIELNAILESTKYSPMMQSDGGNCPNVYEVGTQPGLNL